MQMPMNMPCGVARVLRAKLWIDADVNNDININHVHLQAQVLSQSVQNRDRRVFVFCYYNFTNLNAR